MSIMSSRQKLAACLLNISEGRDSSLIERIAKAALAPFHGIKSEIAVLNIFSDKIYNRSVISIAGTPDGLSKGVVNASKEALISIDISKHEGGHPRKGAVDLIPIHPLNEFTSLEDCGELALFIGQSLHQSHRDLKSFYFGHADVPLKRDLVQRRKDIGWFKVDASQKEHKSGMVGIGAILYMTNFNVMLNTSDIQLGQSIAKEIRARSGGILGVQAMAFPHGDQEVEVACNVDLFEIDDTNPVCLQAVKNEEIVKCYGKYYISSFKYIQDTITSKAMDKGCTVQENSKIIGFTPQEACQIITNALKNEDSWLVGRFNQITHM